jgi:hypothetical protein
MIARYYKASSAESAALPQKYPYYSLWGSK